MSPRRRRRLPTLLVLAGLAVAPAACSDPSPGELCASFVRASCSRAYHCLGVLQLQDYMLPATEDQCVQSLGAVMGCDQLTDEAPCLNPGHYNADAAAACLDETRLLSCEVVRTGVFAGPSCAQVCTM